MRTSCHDYPSLIARWRALARASGLRLLKIAQVDGYPVYCIKTPALSTAPGLYLSAGIHGDEPASTEGLLAWAQSQQASLRGLPLLLFPCLNPWGLARNQRSDAAGNDLNRMFHLETHPTTAAVRRVAGPHCFSAAMLLHEDYDALGIYLYEHSRTPPFGELILQAAESVIPRDPRSKIDGRSAGQGVLRPRLSPKKFEKIGHPEAVWLHLSGCRRSVTFETPSEMALELRIRAQMAAIGRIVELHGKLGSGV